MSNFVLVIVAETPRRGASGRRSPRPYPQPDYYYEPAHE
jgi:hypothetical protein